MAAGGQYQPVDREEVDSVWFLSHGGVGHTHICRYVVRTAIEASGLSMNTDTGSDGLKHIPAQGVLRAVQQTGARPVVVVLFDDPVHASLSLDRRGFSTNHFLPMHNDNSPDYQANKLRLRVWLKSNLPQLTDDYLGIMRWMHSYLATACRPDGPPFHMVFVRTSTLNATVDSLVRYLGADPALVDHKLVDPQYVSEQKKSSTHGDKAAALERVFASYKAAIAAPDMDFLVVPQHQPCSSTLRRIADTVGPLADSSPNLLADFKASVPFQLPHLPQSDLSDVRLSRRSRTGRPSRRG